MESLQDLVLMETSNAMNQMEWLFMHTKTKLSAVR